MAQTVKTGMSVTKDHFGNITFSGQMNYFDIARLQLDSFDLAVLEDCSGPEASPAEWLLGLQRLFFRLQEQSGWHPRKQLNA